jgi:hypothetical protein
VNADGGQGVAHVFELEGLNDSNDELHGPIPGVAGMQSEMRTISASRQDIKQFIAKRRAHPLPRGA